MIQFFLRLIKIKHKSRKYFTLIPRIDLEKGIIFIAFKLRIYPRVLEIYLNSLRQKEVPNLPTFQTLSTSRYREISTCDFSSQQIIFICIFHCPPPLYLHPIVAPCSFPTFSSSTTTPRPSIFPPRKRSKQKLPPIHFPTSNFRLELYQRSFYPCSLNPSPHLSTTSYAVKSRNTPQIWDGWKDPPFRWIYVNHVEESPHVGKFVGAPSISSIDLKQSNMCDVSWVKVKRVVYRYIYIRLIFHAVFHLEILLEPSDGFFGVRLYLNFYFLKFV